jgi:hypothetical protein
MKISLAVRGRYARKLTLMHHIDSKFWNLFGIFLDFLEIKTAETLPEWIA